MATVTKDKILRLVALYMKDLVDSGEREGDIFITNAMDELGLLDTEFETDEEEAAAEEDFMNAFHDALNSLL